MEALLALNLLIFVHELGHFLAARWRGMKVARFAIWFGKPIWCKKINGVEYALGWIPAGGYVSLPQMATMEAIEGKTEEKSEQLPNVSPWDKIIVALAGPLFSFLLAVLFAVVVWQVGKPVSVGDDVPVLGWVTPDGPAWKAGLRPGDRIIAVNGEPVNHFGPPSQESIVWRVITSGGTNISITFTREDKPMDPVTLVPFKRETKWYERRALREISVEPTSEARVGAVITNSPADRAGLKPGDIVQAVDGQKIYSIRAVEYIARQMTNDGARPAIFTVQRGAGEVQVSMLAQRPDSPTNAPMMFGIAWMDSTNRALAKPTPWQQIVDSGKQIFATIGAVISKHTDIGAQQLGGAVMIIRVYSNFFQSDDGWRWVLWFSVVLNVNLALLNMLPLPVLDGGHILLSLIEIIRRRAVSPRLLNYIQSGFALLLISFMLWIAFYDIGDWVRSGRRGGRNQAVIFNPK